jgi:hypothetical protein
MEADGGVRKRLSLLHIDNVGSGGQKAAGLALERKVLGVKMDGGEHGDREEAANCESVDEAKIHVISTPLEGSRLPPVTFRQQSPFNTTKADSSSTLLGW